MAANSNTKEKTERCLSQVAKEHPGHFMEGQSQNWTTRYRRHPQWKKTLLAWTCDTNGRFRGLRELQIVRVQTGGAQSTRTC